MKKKLFLLVTTVFAACGIFSACADNEHKHDYKTDIISPTCTQGGYTAFTCSCGEEYTANETPATGHSYDKVVTTAPTCSEKGYTSHICVSCGDFYIDGYVSAKGHTFGEEAEVAPTCTTVGYTVQVCEECGLENTTDFIKYSGHKFVDNVCTQCDGTEFTYTLNPDGESYSVSKGTANLINANIPEAYSGKPVTAVSGSGFYYSTLLESVEIPDSVTQIGNAAFFKCPALKEITIGGAVKEIGDRAFFDCAAVTTVNFNAAECDDLYEDNDIFYKAGADGSGINLNVGAHVKKIPANLFCSEATDTAPNLKILKFAADAECEQIGEKAFYNAVSLEDITVPENITDIGAGAFYNCLQLTKIAFNAKSTRQFLANNDVFYNAGQGGDGIAVTIGKDVSVLSDYLFFSAISPKITSVAFADGVLEKIGKYSFGYCKDLTEISVPATVAEISTAAFAGCSALESMTLPFVGGSVKSVDDNGQYPFGYIFGESNYDGGDRVQQEFIDDGSTTTKFYYIPSSLRSVKILGGNILQGAFYGCVNLTDIVIPEDITSIGAYAFYECRALTSAVIPENVAYIGEYAYYECYALNSILYKATLCEDFAVEQYRFDAAVRNNTFSYAGSRGAGIDVYITKNVTKIPDNLFCPYLNALNVVTPLIKSVTFEESSVCERIGESAFCNSSGLESITFGGALSVIADRAFSGCSALKEIALPETLTAIGISAFQNCTELSEVSAGDNIRDVKTAAFDGTEYFANEENWESEVLYLGNVLLKSKTSVTECNIKSNTAIIADNAFDNCVSLRTVSIPATVVSIGSSAFYRCGMLKAIDIPHSVTHIGNNAFMACNALAEIRYNANCEDFGETSNIFYESGTGSTVIFGKDVGFVPSYLFFGCTISNVKFERGSVCTSINRNAFSGSNITTLYLPKSLQTIDYFAFKSCALLEHVYYEGGSAAEWSALNILGDDNDKTFKQEDTKIHYYSETAQSSEDYWYYKENGEAQIWGRA